MEFHIHLNATKINYLLLDYFKTNGFYQQPFELGNKPVNEEVNYHLTKKFTNSTDFKNTFKKILAFPEIETKVVGYIEGEVVTRNIKVPFKTLNTDVIEVPFTVSTTKQTPGIFRESEIHISANIENSSKIMFAAFKEMGFEEIILFKSTGKYIVFSLQGDLQSIRKIVDLTLNFITIHGGLFDCKIKEEKTAKWWLSSPDVIQPPIIDKFLITVNS